MSLDRSQHKSARDNRIRSAEAKAKAEAEAEAEAEANSPSQWIIIIPPFATLMIFGDGNNLIRPGF